MSMGIVLLGEWNKSADVHYRSPDSYKPSDQYLEGQELEYLMQRKSAISLAQVINPWNYGFCSIILKQFDFIGNSFGQNSKL